MDEERAEQTAEIFKRFDLNGNGKISRLELDTVFTRLDPVQWTKRRLDLLWDQVDVDKNGSIEIDEFSRWLFGRSGDERDGWEDDRGALLLRERKSFDPSALIQDRREIVGKTDSFTATLDIGRKKLGIKVESADEISRVGSHAYFTTLVIKDIQPEGFLGTWNLSNYPKIMEGDKLVEINGVVGDAQKMKLILKNADKLVMVVNPETAGSQFLHNISKFYNVDRRPFEEGMHSSVFMASHRKTRERYAVKKFSKMKVESAQFENAVAMIKTLDHPNVIRLFDVFEDNRSFHLVLEYCGGNNLFERILEDSHFTERQAAGIMRQLISGVAHMHSKKICHRDIKPESLMLKQKADDITSCTIKIIDFRTAVRFERRPRLQGRVGDVSYSAPEIVIGTYDQKIDLWSCGVILYLALAGYLPYVGDTDSQTLRRIVEDGLAFPSPDWHDVSQEGSMFVEALLAKDPMQRVTASEALQNVWLEQHAPTVNNVPLVTAQHNMKSFCSYGKLKKAALHAMAHRFTDDQVSKLRDMWSVLDVNGDGTVTFYELKAGLDRWGRRDAIDDLVASLEAMDVDGDARLNYSEFLAAAVEKQHFRSEEACWAAFQAFDRDGDGVIDLQELTVALGLDQEADMETVKEAMSKADRDGNGDIDFEEFKRMMREDEY